MNLIPLFKDDELLNRYRRLREVGRNLNNHLVTLVPKAALLECGKKLGLVQGKTLVLDNEEELSILFDYCLYNYRHGGKNIIERYLETSPTLATEDEMILLKGKLDSYYSLFSVEEVHQGRGATLRDILRNKTLLLMDLGIGKSAVPGLLFAGRVVPLADFHMTTGTFIPVSDKRLVEKAIMPIVNKFLRHNKPTDDSIFSPGQEAALAAQIIRVLLRAGSLDKMIYQDI